MKKLLLALDAKLKNLLGWTMSEEEKAWREAPDPKPSFKQFRAAQRRRKR